MLLSALEKRQVISSAESLALTAPARRVEDFIARTLGLNPVQQALYFPSPDPDGSLEIAVADLTLYRENTLTIDCLIPNFVVYEDRGVSHIAGLETYLRYKRHNARLRRRIRHHSLVRQALRALEQGNHLEALAAAILEEACGRGEATQKSGDQGIDVIAWKELINIDGAFSDGNASSTGIFPGRNVIVLASSKKVAGSGRGKPKLLEVAHVRELVGGWVIQRSPVGRWKDLGIQTLTPIQMLLVTSYRLSVDARFDCKTLGVQVWGIPELIYLICAFAPDDVFDTAMGFAFSGANFRKWWAKKDSRRLIAA